MTLNLNQKLMKAIDKLVVEGKVELTIKDGEPAVRLVPKEPKSKPLR